MSLSGDWLELPEGGVHCPERRALRGASRLAERLMERLGRWQVSAGPAVDPAGKPIRLVRDPEAGFGPEGYELEITPRCVNISGATEKGVFYGACTLRQLLAQFGFRLPALHIKDRPDFAVRGVMLDVSRDKVPTLDTLLKLVDMLADWKINHVELYTEHTFAYLKHEAVWKDASPVTGEDILLLDRYCRERFIELTPNQNSFGHMHRWLINPEYKHLAESPDGFDTPWGTRFEGPFSLCPWMPAA